MSTDTTFAALGVPTSLTAVLEDRGITTPGPNEAATLPASYTRCGRPSMQSPRWIR